MGAAAVVAPRGNPGLRLLLMAAATYDWADEQYVPPPLTIGTPRHCFWAQVILLGGPNRARRLLYSAILYPAIIIVWRLYGEPYHIMRTGPKAPKVDFFGWDV